MAKFDFDAWFIEEEINGKTKTVLFEEDLNTEKALKRFQIDEIQGLQLSKGQSSLLRGALASFQATVM